MADRIVLNTPRFKGEYPLDLADEPLTSLEWRWVKKISGYMPMTIEDGMAGLDPDLFLAFAVIALRRSGRIQKEEALLVADSLADLPATDATIKVIFDTVDEEPEDEDPPQPEPEPATEPPLRSIGTSSNATSDPLAPGQSRTGTQG